MERLEIVLPCQRFILCDLGLDEMNPDRYRSGLSFWCAAPTYASMISRELLTPQFPSRLGCPRSDSRAVTVVFMPPSEGTGGEGRLRYDGREIDLVSMS